MTIELKNIFSKKITKYTGLLLVLIFLLVIFLLNMDYIMGYLENKKHISNHNNEKFNNVCYKGHDTSGTKGYLTLDNSIIEEFSGNAETVMERLERNYKIIIEPKKREVSVNFKAVEKSEINLTENIKGYLLILAKYNSALEQVGHINARITNETQDYTKYIEKMNINGIITNDAKINLLTLLGSDLSSVSSNVIAGRFDGTDGYKLLSSITELSSGNKTYTSNERQKEFLKLLELVYNDKYYNKALKVGSSYNTGIASLYNDFKTLFTDDIFTITEFDTDTNNEVIINEDNLTDQRQIVIKSNKKDVETIKKELITLSSKDIPDIALEFLNIFLEKYSILSNDTGKFNKSGICNVDGQCNYVFENLEDKDNAGNFYYYKLGIGMIYNISTGTTTQENISNIYTYKFGSGGKLTYFKLDNSLEEQERLLKRLEEIEQTSILSQKEKNKPIQPMVEDINYNSMDAYMKMLEPHIGNYPDEFTLREQDVKDLSLADYLNKSLSRGTINVDVDIKDIVVTNDEE